MKLKNLLILTSIVFAFSAGCEQKDSLRVIKLAHALDRTHSVHKAMEFMAEKLEEKSGGKMRMDIYPSQQLGTERECLELLQIGSLDMTKVSAAVMESYSDNYKIFGIPYLFRDTEHQYEVLDSEIGQKLLGEGEKYWMQGLCFYASGSRSFYTKNTPIRKPEDVEGLKVRVMQSATSINMVRTMGGSPTPISFGELYTALQQGVVDGAENNPPSFYLSRHYEVCKYYTLDEHTSIPDIVLVSTTLWESLSEQEKEWLQAAANESVPVQRELWDESEQEALNAVKEAGVEIIYPDKPEFVEATEEMYDDYRDVGDVYQLIQQIKAM
jgi:tripartite ATP-independent transporter DctP family solute receptor